MSRIAPARAVGPASDPAIAAHLQRIDAKLRAAGVRFTDATELLRQAASIEGRPAGTIMVPPVEYEDDLVSTAKRVWMPIRKAIGRPLRIRNAYRDPTYNAARGGSKGSLHQMARALDLYPLGDVSTAELKLAAAQWWLANRDLEPGLGVYTANVHIDGGPSHPRRPAVWGDGKRWIAKARVA